MAITTRSGKTIKRPYDDENLDVAPKKNRKPDRQPLQELGGTGRNKVGTTEAASKSLTEERSLVHPHVQSTSQTVLEKSATGSGNMEDVDVWKNDSASFRLPARRDADAVPVRWGTESDSAVQVNLAAVNASLRQLRVSVFSGRKIEQENVQRALVENVRRLKLANQVAKHGRDAVATFLEKARPTGSKQMKLGPGMTLGMD